MEDNVEKNEAAKQQVAPGQEAVTESAAEQGGAGENAADRFHHLLSGLLLHDVAIGPRPENAFGVYRLVVHRQHEYP